MLELNSVDTRDVVVLAEYQRCRRETEPPSAADLRLAQRMLVEDGSSGIAIRWLANGEVDITTSSWVGVIRFSHLDVHVVPKLVGGALRVLRMLEYAAGVSILRRLPSDRPLPADGRDLFDLICLLLSEEAASLLRDGLMRDYRPTEDALVVLRGRLRHREQYLRRYGQLDRLECQFDDYDTNNLENQLVAAALVMARRRARDDEIRSRLRRLAAIYTEACDPTSGEADYYEDRIQYGRRNERYRASHELAKLVLRGLAFDDLYDTSSGDVASFLIDMNVVFERFVSRLVAEALAGTSLRVSTQHRVKAVIRDDQTGRSYSTIVPDLVIEDPVAGRQIPIDIKYKDYSNKKISSSDIYQTFLYAYALERDPTTRRAGIIYPATSSKLGPFLSIKPTAEPVAARILSAGIDVAAALDMLHDRATVLPPVADMVNALTDLKS